MYLDFIPLLCTDKEKLNVKMKSSGYADLNIQRYEHMSITYEQGSWCTAVRDMHYSGILKAKSFRPKFVFRHYQRNGTVARCIYATVAHIYGHGTQFKHFQYKLLH